VFGLVWRADQLKRAGDAEGTALFKKWAGGRKERMARGGRMYM
jgi:hypothetical protein